MYRAITVDDQSVFRDIIRSLLENAGDFEVVGEATDGDEVLDLYVSTNPDLVVMDVQMERVNGFQATARLLQHDRDACVFITSMSHDPEYSKLAQEAGAAAFFNKRALQIDHLRSILEYKRQPGTAAA